MNTKIGYMLLAGCIGLLAVQTQQIFAAELKVGVINMSKLLKESPQAKAANERLQKEFAPQQQNLLVQQKKLKTLEDKLQKSGPTMSDSQKMDTENRVRELQRDLSRRQNDYLDDLNMRRNQELGKLQRIILKEVQDFAKDQKYDLIIGDGVFYASSAIDVTDRILDRLTRDYKAKSGNGKK